MASYRIDVEKVKRSAVKMEHQKDNLDDVIAQLIIIMKDIDDAWDADGIETFQEGYQTIVDNLKQQADTLDDIYKYIANMVQARQNLEIAAAQAASGGVD